MGRGPRRDVLGGGAGRLGAPDHLKTSHEGDLRRTEATYDDRGLELTFVNDILVRIRQLEPEPR